MSARVPSFRVPNLLRTALAVPTACALIFGAACKPATEEAPVAEEAAPAGPAAENPDLGIALAMVPEGFQVVTNEGAELRLAPAPPKEGELWFELTAPEIGGVNLVQEVNDLKTHFESLPEGQFAGQLELGTQFGPAYQVRGRYSEEGATREQLRLVALAPSGAETLTLIYDYPLGEDTKERSQDLFAVFGELEGLYAEPAGDEEPSEDTSEGSESSAG